MEEGRPLQRRCILLAIFRDLITMLDPLMALSTNNPFRDLMWAAFEPNLRNISTP